MLIGIVAGVLIVGALSYATGLTKLIRSSFGSSAEYKSSESATAPELATGEWINSEPLKLTDLRGRVVLIEFWTFGCINCRNTLPFVKSWADRYRKKGLTVITMGHSRPRPKHLAKKLLQIRLRLGMSQGELVKRLGVQALIHYTNISKYELDKNEPPLAILLAYARLAEIPVERIIDDDLELTDLIS